MTKNKEIKQESDGIALSFTPHMIFSHYVIRRCLKGDLDEFIKELDRQRRILKQVSGYNWDNPHYYFTNSYNDEFQFLIYRNTHTDNVRFAFYDKKGTCLFNEVIPKTNRDEFINDIFRISDLRSKGKMYCSDCKTIMDYEENRSHVYFGGLYCSDCWEREWKVIATNQNYN